MTWRPLTRADRVLAFGWLVAAVLAVLAQPVLAILPVLLSPCGFKNLTGLPCMACGATRSSLALLAARIGEAFAFHPLTAIAGVLFFVGAVVAPVWALGRWPVPVPSLPRAWWIVAVTAVLANWAYLIVAGV